jgi:hypothetical protein
VHLLLLEAIFRLVSFFHKSWTLGDFASGGDQYPYLSLCSFDILSFTGPPSWVCCWFSKASKLLLFVAISLDCLPSFRDTLDALCHILSFEKDGERVHLQEMYLSHVDCTS